MMENEEECSGGAVGPTQGWHYPKEQVSSEDGVSFSAMYFGCIAIHASMREIGARMRSIVTK